VGTGSDRGQYRGRIRGYGRRRAGNDSFEIYSIAKGVAGSNIITYDLTAGMGVSITVGDSFGITHIGTQICVYFKGSGAGAWSNVRCATGAAAQSGRIGLVISGSNAFGGTDDFGGGASRPSHWCREARGG